MTVYDHLPRAVELVSVATLESQFVGVRLMGLLEEADLAYRVIEYASYPSTPELPRPEWGILFVEKGREQEALALLEEAHVWPELQPCLDCGLALDETTDVCPACGTRQLS